MTDITLTALEPYTKPKKANPYDGIVAQVADATESAGDTVLGKFIVPAETTPGYARVQVQKAAREAGYSAQIEVEEQTADGHVLGFTLHPRRVRKPAKSGTVDTGEAVASSDDTTGKG